MKRTTINFLAIGCALALGNIFHAEAIDIKDFTLPTPWTQAALESETPLPEYPRPQMARNQWMNLNGMWEYMGGENTPDPVSATAAPVFTSKTEKIRVPYPPESELSGIVRKGGKPHVV